MFKKRKLKKEAYSIDHSDTVLKYVVGNMALEIDNLNRTGCKGAFVQTKEFWITKSKW